MNLIEELKWRGMLHDVMPGTEDLLTKEMTSGYIGFDPTADSLHIGSLVQIMILMHFQRAGHKPYALIGGATGMVGDPSGKSEERNLLSKEDIAKNIAGIKTQLSQFLDFDCANNAAKIVNNYDWFATMNFLDFIRDIGKHITINYMLAKDSVQKRLEAGLSFTEFTYQLVQGYDFYHLFTQYNCKIQMGGSDQWGNIVTGTELIRRKTGKEAFALTCPLVTKADGGKFGKTEKGNIWLDKTKTSPYKFYQFWLNCSDEDAVKYCKIFTFLEKEEIENLETEHNKAPHLRLLQKTIAREVTIMVHSEEDYNAAVKASNILFGNCTTDELKELPGEMILSVFEGVPHANLSLDEIIPGIGIIDFLVSKTSFLSSNGEARRALKENSIRINKDRVVESDQIDKTDLIGGHYIILQRGKKNYFLVIVK